MMTTKKMKVPQLKQEDLQRYFTEFGRMPIETDWNFDEEDIEKQRKIVWYELDLTWNYKSVRFSEFRDIKERIYIYPIIETENHVFQVITSNKDKLIGYTIERPSPLYPTPLLGKLYSSSFATVWFIISSFLFMFSFSLYDSSIIEISIFLLSFVGLYIQWIAIYRTLRTYSLCCRHQDISQFSAIKLRLFSRERHGDIAKKFFMILLLAILCCPNFFLDESSFTFTGFFILLLIGSFIIAIILGAPYEMEDFPPENEQKNLKFEKTIHYLIATVITCFWIIITNLYFHISAYLFIESLDLYLPGGIIIDISPSAILGIAFILGKIILWYSAPGFLCGGLIRLGLMWKKSKYGITKTNN